MKTQFSALMFSLSLPTWWLFLGLVGELSSVIASLRPSKADSLDFKDDVNYAQHAAAGRLFEFRLPSIYYGEDIEEWKVNFNI